MQVSSYQDSYMDLLAMLHETNNVEVDLEHLPKLGFIVTEGSIPVAAGFLRRMEGGYAMFDTIVTNNDLTSDLRHEGLSLLVKTLVQNAQGLKLKGLLGFTTDHGIVLRAQELGFRVNSQHFLAKSFT